MNSFFRKLRWLTRRSDKEAELREELQFHLEEEAEQRQDDGLTEDAARWAARRELGNLALVEENTRAAWGWTRLEQLARDAGYGLRQVRRNPVFSGHGNRNTGARHRRDYRDVQRVRRGADPPAALRRRGPARHDLGSDAQTRTSRQSTSPRPRSGSSGAVSIPYLPISPRVSRRTRHCPAMVNPNRFRHARLAGLYGAYLACRPCLDVASPKMRTIRACAWL